MFLGVTLASLSFACGVFEEEMAVSKYLWMTPRKQAPVGYRMNMLSSQTAHSASSNRSKHHTTSPSKTLSHECIHQAEVNDPFKGDG